MKRISQITKLLLIITICHFVIGCKSINFTKADKQFEQGEYFEAQKSYRKLYNELKSKNKRDQRALAAYKLGLCYMRLSQPSRAVTAFTNALRYGYPDSVVLLNLAESLQKDGKYKESLNFYERYLTNDETNIRALIGRSGVKIALRNSLGTGNRYKVSRANFLNTRRSEYSPILTGEDFDRIYFTSTGEQSAGDLKSTVTGMKNGDIWYTRKNEHGEWLSPEPVEGNLNSEFDEGIISFSPDGEIMYLTRASASSSSDAQIELFISRRSDARWSEPVKYNLEIDSIYDYGHPSVSPDGKYLYFSSNMPGGYGGYDLWRVNLHEEGNYLENLGPQINTPEDEFFPYSRADSLLYFSSTGHPGFGGLDIFKASLQANGQWRIENMGLPMNSEADDFGITFGKGETGYLSSNRKDVKGYDHIYSFELPDLKVNVSGYIMDPEEYIIPEATLRIVGNDGTNRRERVRDDGSFTFSVEPGISYVMLASAPEYLNARQEFTTEDIEEDATYYVDFMLSPIHRPMIVDNIFYDFDKATLREESRTALDSIAGIMEHNPNITIELASHTDRKGTDKYNDNLSERRAAAAVDYLVNEAGIDARRITSKGYGKRRPMKVTPRIAKIYPMFEEGIELTPEFIESLPEQDARDAADQINRRTEFEITSIDFYLY